MALDFPASPTNGQVYGAYYYDSTVGAWRTSPAQPTTTTVSTTKPSNAQPGDTWYDTSNGTFFIYYNDGDSSQWVEVQASSSLNTALEGRIGVLETLESTKPASPNYLINGLLEVNQRAFSSATANAIYTYDRWRTVRGGAADGTVTFTSVSLSPGSIAGLPQAVNAIQLASTGQTATDSRTALIQRIEDVRTLSGKTVTLSFWAKASSGTPYISAYFEQAFGTGGSSQVTTSGSKQAITATWARYSFTTTIPSVLGMTVGDGSSLTALITTSSGSAYDAYTGAIGLQAATIQITGLQLEEGSTALPFRRNAPSLQAELAACQRYYWRQGGDDLYQIYGFGVGRTATIAQIHIMHPVPMRTKPSSMDYLNLNLGDTIAVSAAVTGLVLNTATSSPMASIVEATSTGLTARHNYYLRANNSLAAYLGFSAEL